MTTTTEKLITALEEKGFKRWTKGDKDRMYIDAEKLGLKVQKYGSGAVKHAEWLGEKISNREGASMLHAKTYLDLTDMSVHSDDSDLLAAAEAIIEEIRASLEEEEKEAAMSTTTAVTAMQELYQGISYDARMDYCTKEMAQRICRNTLEKEAERRGIADPMMMNPATGSVSPLSEWICDYMELTPEEWGGHYFSDAGLVEVRRTADGGWEEDDIERRTAAILEALKDLYPSVDTLTEGMLPEVLKDCAIVSPATVKHAIYASSRLLTLDKLARFFATVYTQEDVHTFLAAYAAAAPKCYDQDKDLENDAPMCMPWRLGAMGANKGDTPETLGRKAACKDYGELEALFGPDEEGLAARTEAAVRGYLLDGLALPEFLKPEEGALRRAASYIAEAQERIADDEVKNSIVSELVVQCVAEVTALVAMRRAR